MLDCSSIFLELVIDNVQLEFTSSSIGNPSARPIVPSTATQPSVEEEVLNALHVRSYSDPSTTRAQVLPTPGGEEHRIAAVVVFFPLPTKDPLLHHRHMHDIARAFRVHTQDLLRCVVRVALIRWTMI